MPRSSMGTGGSGTTFNVNTTTYSPLQGVPTQSSSEAGSQMYYGVAGQLSKLGVNVRTNTLTTDATVFTLRKNGADGNLTLSITAGVTGFFTSTNSDTFSAGDLLNWKVAIGNTGSGSIIINSVTVRFSATDGSKNVVYHGEHDTTGINYSATSARGLGFWGSPSNSTTLEEVVMTVAGVLSYLSINVTANARTTTTNFTLRKNGADATQTIAIGAGLTGVFTDTTHTDSYSVNDSICGRLTFGSGTETITCTGVNITDTISTSQTSQCISGAYPLSASRSGSAAQGYWALFGGPTTFDTTAEARRQTKMLGPSVFSNLSVYIGINSYTTDATLKFRKNGADGNQSVTITAGVTGRFTDSTHTDNVISGDLIDFSINGGTTGIAHFGFFSVNQKYLNPRSNGFVMS